MPELDLTRFPRYDELTTWLQGVAAEHPHLATLASIGKSYEGRDIWVMTLTSATTGPHDEKPAFWIDANIHAGEVTGSVSALYAIDHLTRGYGTDPQVTRLLDRSTFYIAPRLSPDGAERYLTTPETLRSSVRPYPHEEERDGLTPQDINGDGLILTMRVPDPKGPWKVSDKDPRLLRRRDATDEDGTFYQLWTEGVIRNYDGFTFRAAPPRYGLDFNRHFAYDWTPENQQRGAGPYPMAEPETRAIAEFFRTHRNINGVHTYHTYSGVLLHPYGDQPDDALPTHDLKVYQHFGAKGTELTGYPTTSVWSGFKYDPKDVTHGNFDDWVYDHLGIYCFTNELWDIIGASGVKDREFIKWFTDHPEEDDLGILAFNDEHDLGGFHDWTPFDHPQLGRVEIGGWDTKRVWQNAPAKFLPDVARNNALFSLAQAEASPRLGLKLARALPQDGDVWRVVIVLENLGFLPTYTSARGRERDAVRPIRVTLDLPDGVTVVGDAAPREVGHLEGRSNLLVGAFGAAPVGLQEVKVEWFVRGEAGKEIEVVARAERAGTVRQKIVLG